MPELWSATVRCATCNAVINEAKDVPENEKTNAMLGAPFISFCKVRQHNTFSDLNWHFNVEWTLQQSLDTTTQGS